MAKSNSKNQENFLYPLSSYYGKLNPENLAFNQSLQEFAQKIGYITNLQTNGKLSSQEAYKQIKVLWKNLKHSHKQLTNSYYSSLEIKAKTGLRQRELCEKIGLDYKQVAANAQQQRISTHEYVQKITGWTLRDELYYPPEIII